MKPLRCIDVCPNVIWHGGKTFYCKAFRHSFKISAQVYHCPKLPQRVVQVMLQQLYQ